MCSSPQSQNQKKSPQEEKMESSAKGLGIEEIKEVEEEKEEDDLEKKPIKRNKQQKKIEIEEEKKVDELKQKPKEKD